MSRAPVSPHAPQGHATLPDAEDVQCPQNRFDPLDDNAFCLSYPSHCAK